MLKNFASVAGIVFLATFIAVPAFAKEIEGTIKKVAGGGEIVVVVTDKKKKEVNIKVTRKTKLEGVGKRSRLKVGQRVTVEHKRGEAKAITVHE